MGWIYIHEKELLPSLLRRGRFHGFHFTFHTVNSYQNIVCYMIKAFLPQLRNT